MRVRALSRSPAAFGLELAGIAVTRVDDDAAAAETVSHWATDSEIGIILVDETLYQALPHDLLTRLDRQALPIIARVPAAQWDEHSQAEEYILGILRQAIGYRVRPR